MHDEHDIDWQKDGTRTGPDLGLIQTRFDAMRHPSGEPVLDRLVLESADWANCVAETDDGRIVLVEQYRFGREERTLEPPGGCVDPGESPIEAIQRELLEETGYGGGSWQQLETVQPNPAILSNLCYHFHAKGVRRLREPDPGEGEVIRVVLVTPRELRAAVADGRMRHALAITGFSQVFDLFGARA